MYDVLLECGVTREAEVEQRWNVRDTQCTNMVSRTISIQMPMGIDRVYRLSYSTKQKQPFLLHSFRY